MDLDEILPFEQERRIDEESLNNLLNDESLSDIEKVKKMYIFVSDYKTDDGLRTIWITKPLTIEPTNRVEGPPWAKVHQSGYAINSYGFIIDSDSEQSVWSTNTFNQNVKSVLDSMHKTACPIRTDKPSAIVEANDINYLINQVAIEINITPLKFEIWSVYEILRFMGKLSTQKVSM